MVVKPHCKINRAATPFESRVILDGSQTSFQPPKRRRTFESRVILDGSQTRSPVVIEVTTFESRVILDGSQTLYFLISRVYSV